MDKEGKSTEEGMNKELLCYLRCYGVTLQFKSASGLWKRLLRCAVLLSENYNGFKSNDLHKVGCIFKCFISSLVGIALKEELISSLDEKLMDFYVGEVPNDIDDEFFNLTLRHIMMKTSGINWPNPTEKLPTNMQEVFKLKFKDKPGVIFEYKPDPQIIIYLMEKLTGKEFVSYVDEKLMAPLGIKHYLWEKSHIEDIQIRIDELVKLGELYLNRGKRREFTFFTEDYYYESVKAQVKGGFPEQSYVILLEVYKL